MKMFSLKKRGGKRSEAGCRTCGCGLGLGLPRSVDTKPVRGRIFIIDDEENLNEWMWNIEREEMVEQRDLSRA